MLRSVLNLSFIALLPLALLTACPTSDMPDAGDGDGEGFGAVGIDKAGIDTERDGLIFKAGGGVDQPGQLAVPYLQGAVDQGAAGAAAQRAVAAPVLHPRRS